MGYEHSTYHFYGVNVPKEQWTHRWAEGEAELVQQVLRAVSDIAPDVACLTAGDYGDDMLFLGVHRPGVSFRIPLGKFQTVNHSNARDLGWDAQLMVVADTMGYGDLDRPGWIVCPDVT